MFRPASICSTNSTTVGLPGNVEVPDQVRSVPQVVGPAVHVKDDRLFALIRIRGDAETILAPVAGKKHQRTICIFDARSEAENRDSVVQVAGNAVPPRGGLFLMSLRRLTCGDEDHRQWPRPAPYLAAAR